MGAVRLDSGLLRVTLGHEGEENCIVQLYRAGGEGIGTLANEIGDYKESVDSLGTVVLRPLSGTTRRAA